MIRLLAYRGYSAFCGENSAFSWIAAVDADADGIEIDVRQSRDGVFVCAHDPDLRLQYVAFNRPRLNDNVHAAR